jgi:hypothetical protein
VIHRTHDGGQHGQQQRRLDPPRKKPLRGSRNTLAGTLKLREVRRLQRRPSRRGRALTLEVRPQPPSLRVIVHWREHYGGARVQRRLAQRWGRSRAPTPYSEAAFKTLKYRPGFPDRFASIDQAREFCRDFIRWYNERHRHAGIGLMTPSVVHHGHAEQVHAARARVLAAAYAATPETLRPTRAPTTRAARRRLDQQTQARGARRSLNSQTTCLIRLDRFR